ncbi:response regulator transcription factor [Chitiniphilus eburneus]|uniref:Response regulator transcription factor n=1 Tax=Chitiniphilus eburneus TaxID=2571148 RepID=A0A4U0Q1M0_9NEIS|nr:response regulator transcription factor [Chitiniphilus eburneus]TJZ74847.1 response regulator transcription factor [Chitiniphilus eburneus]
MRIAVLDDDPVHLDLIASLVTSLKFDCVRFSRGEELKRQLRRESFDLLLLDWELPDMSGLELLQWLRQNEDTVPVILLTCRNQERDVVAALNHGADDFMSKPIRLAELKARLQATLRRIYPEQGKRVLHCGGYVLDLDARSVRYQDEWLALTQKEFDLAHCLFANTGRLLSRGYLIEAVWGTPTDLPSRTLDTHVSSLRNKLRLRPERGFRLSATYGQGYRLEALVPEQAP